MGNKKIPDWAGMKILHRTVVPSKRRVIGSEDILIPTDLREWITSADHQEIKQVITGLDLPSDKASGSFDKRALIVWRYVAEKVTYRSDPTGQKQQDFWQFPAETLALGKGDCEDCAFLLATLLLASGISPFCVRVVFGRYTDSQNKSTGHAWTIYKDECGFWRLLESTLDKIPDKWPLADDLVHHQIGPRYQPHVCLNRSHVWTVDQTQITDVGAYVSNNRSR